MATRVINIRNATPGAPNEVYIGRKNGDLPQSDWHNPFIIGKHGDREQVIKLYAEYLSRQTDLLARIDELKDKTLVCYCAPKKCHGHILASLADSSTGSIKYGDITITKITNNPTMEDTMKSNPTTIEEAIELAKSLIISYYGEDEVHFDDHDIDLKDMRDDLRNIANEAMTEDHDEFVRHHALADWLNEPRKYNKIPYENYEDDTMSTEDRKAITLHIEVEIKKEEIMGKDVLGWLRTDLHSLKPMRFVGMTVVETAEMLNTPYPFHIKANFSSTEEITKPEFLKPWVEKTINGATENYTITVESYEFGNSQDTIAEIEDQVEARREIYAVVEGVEVYVVPSVTEEDFENPTKFFISSDDLEEIEENAGQSYDLMQPEYQSTMDRHEFIEAKVEDWISYEVKRHIAKFNNQSQEDTKMQPEFQFPDADNDVQINSKKPDNVQEDIMPTPKRPEFKLPGIDEEYRISWRLDDTRDWEFEVNRPTLNQALHYIADASNMTGEYKLEQVVGTEVFIININHTKEDTVYEYKLWMFDQEVQVITNSMPEGEALAMKVYQTEIDNGIQEVIAFKRQAEVTAKWQLDTQGRVTKGIKLKPQFTSVNWQHAMLRERIVRLGGLFRVVTFKKAELANIEERIINRIISDSTFSFAEGESLTVMTVFDRDYRQVAWDEFEDFLGIRITNSPKMGKRMKELTRYTLYWETMVKPLHILEIDFDPAEFGEEIDKAVDGIGAISVSAFKRMVSNIPVESVRNGSYGRLMNGEIRRVNFRYVYADGLIKGDAIVVPDNVLEAKYGFVPDLVQPSVNGEMINLKKELRTDGSWAIMTANPHHAHHQPMTNDQVLSIMSNNADEPWLFPEEQLKEDHLSFIDDVYQDLKNGIFPKFMTADWISDDKAAQKMDPDRLAARLQQLSVRWNMAGRSLLESAFFIRMVGNGFLNRLNKALGKSTDGESKRGKKKIMVPIRHAAYVHVTTLSIIEMCGYDPAEEGWDTTKCFYYEPAHSWVKPDDVFIHDFERHGGEDGDDSEIVMIRNVEFPDGTVKVMAISVRMPTAWGEYSMNEVDTNGFPAYNTWNELPTVIYADRPEFLEEMDQVVAGLPYSDVETPEVYTPDWCHYQVELIKLNPGVGRIINPMIAYYATMHSYFPEQLASTEDFVDCLQQTPDKDAFLAINGEIKRMLELIADSGAVIDDHIYKTRLQSLELPKDSDTTVSTDGFYTRMFRFTAAAAADWQQKVNDLATNRTEIPRLNELTLPESIEVVGPDGNLLSDTPMGVAGFLLRSFNTEYKRYKYIPKGEAKRQFAGGLNNNIVDFIMKQPEQSRHWIMVACYQYIWKTKDRKDNFMFQTPLNAWDKSTMDVLLITLYHLGLAKIQLEDGSWHYKEELDADGRTLPTRTWDDIQAAEVEDEGIY